MSYKFNSDMRQHLLKAGQAKVPKSIFQLFKNIALRKRLARAALFAKRHPRVSTAIGTTAVATPVIPLALNLGISGAKASYNVLKGALALGALGGTALALGHDELKSQLATIDPEDEKNLRLTGMYNARSAEMESKAWATKVRAMRDELQRNYKKMSTDEYKTKYDALVKALDERKSV